MDRTTSTSRHRLVEAAPATAATASTSQRPSSRRPPSDLATAQLATAQLSTAQLSTGLPGDPALAARVARWIDADLISADQGDAILAAERQAPAPTRSGPLLAEALGYVGGVLVLVAVGTLTGRFWIELGSNGRIAVAALATAVLLAGGAVAGASRGPAGARLRAVTWLLAVATTALTLSLVGSDVLRYTGEMTVVLTAGGSAVLAAVLWWLHHTGAQQVAAVATLAVTAGAATALLPAGDEALAGLAVWGVGAAWMLLGRGGLVRPRMVAMVSGGVAVVVGAALCSTTDWGAALALVTAAVLVATGAARSDLVLLAVGSVLTLVAVPVMLSRWFPNALAAPLALLAVGVGLVGAALATVRRRRGARHKPGPEPSARTAIVLAAVVVLGVAAAVTLLGLYPLSPPPSP